MPVNISQRIDCFDQGTCFPVGMCFWSSYHLLNLKDKTRLWSHANERLWGQLCSENDSFRSSCLRLYTWRVSQISPESNSTCACDLTSSGDRLRCCIHRAPTSAIFPSPSLMERLQQTGTFAHSQVLTLHLFTGKALLCLSTAFVRTFVLAKLPSRAIILNLILIEGN